MSGSVLVPALIGAGGSVVGGFIGGCLALAAAHGQSKRDAAQRRVERSAAAALAIADSVAALEAAIVSYGAGDIDSVGLRISFNVFAQVVGAQALAIADDELRKRIRSHLEWVHVFAATASARPVEKVMIEPMRRHADAVMDALDAHVNGLPLPAYDVPPLGDAAALRQWGTRSSASESRS